MNLYRYFDGNGNLLYVGIAVCPISRLSQHRSKSVWFDDVRSVTIEPCKSKQEAQQKETRAIMKEKPRHNKVNSNIESKSKKSKNEPNGISVQQLIQHFGTRTLARKKTGFTLQTFRNWERKGIPTRSQQVIQYLTSGALKVSGK